MSAESSDYLASQGFTLCPDLRGFSAFIGPFYERSYEAEIERALAIENHHLNPEGVVHGGVLLSFADYAIYRAIGDVVSHDIQFATINLTTQFLAAAKQGDIVYGKGVITRKTRSVIFAQGELYTRERSLMTASGIWKIIGQ